jgi:hypothetical protein
LKIKERKDRGFSNTQLSIADFLETVNFSPMKILNEQVKLSSRPARLCAFYGRRFTI